MAIYCILSDIHANLEALEAVLGALPEGSHDRLVILGDLVGYGANPNEVVDRIRDLEPDVIIRGNHDKVAAGIDTTEGFNHLAAQAARWTYDTLTPANRALLEALPQGPLIVDDQFEICHGTPFDEDTYVFDPAEAIRALDSARRPVCVFGHTHVPVAFRRLNGELDMTVPDPERVEHLTFEADACYLINPGSVGQPRDGDARAAYALLDSTRGQLSWRRVTYPVDLAQSKIVRAGLPENLAHRLGLGR